MNKARPVIATKVRQAHAAQPYRRPGVPYNGANMVAQREASSKKNARKATKPRKPSS